MIMAMSTTGDRIKGLREGAGMTQPDLGVIVGRGHSAISKWENGSAEPDLAAIASLARHFGVSADYLLGMADSPSSLGVKAQNQATPVDTPPQMVKDSGDEPPTHPSPAQGSGPVPGGEAMGASQGSSGDGYTPGESIEVTLQKSMNRVSMALLNFSEADKNRSSMMTDVRQMMEQVKDGQGPRSVAGPAPDERREGTAGDTSQQLSADAKRPASDSGRAAV